MSRKTKVVYIFWLHPYLVMIPVISIGGLLMIAAMILPGLAVIPRIWMNPSYGEETDSSPESLRAELERAETLQMLPKWFNKSGIDAEILEILLRVRKQATDDDIKRDVLWDLAALYDMRDRHQEAADTYRELIPLYQKIFNAQLVRLFEKEMRMSECYAQMKVDTVDNRNACFQQVYPGEPLPSEKFRKKKKK
jgi:hypothetical protein